MSIFMSEEDLKAIIAVYQQKAFELFNQNIVLEVQVNSLQKQVNALLEELDRLKKSKKIPKVEEDFN